MLASSHAVFEPPTENRRQPPGRPCAIWMKNEHDDLSSLDLGIHEAIDLLAQERPLCRPMSLHSATTAWVGLDYSLADSCSGGRLEWWVRYITDWGSLDTARPASSSPCTGRFFVHARWVSWRHAGPAMAACLAGSRSACSRATRDRHAGSALYTQGDSDVISMPAGFRRHLVGKTLINVFHCEIRFVGKLMIIRTFS